MFFRLTFLSFLFLCNLYALDPLKPGDQFGDPSIYIEGCVNVISGSFMPSEPDLVLNGPEPIRFTRYYHCGNQEQKDMGTGFWHNYPLNQAKVKKKKWDMTTIVVDSKQGSRLKYRGWSKNRIPLDFSQFSSKTANTRSGYLSGKTHLKNTYALWDNTPYAFTVRNGDGSIRYFSTSKQLIKERLPSGNIIRYRKGKSLDHIIIKDSQEKICLGWMKIYRDSRDRISSIQTSDGRNARYTYKRKKVAVYDRDNTRTYLKEKQSLLEARFISGQLTRNYAYYKDDEKIKVDGEQYKIRRRRLSGIGEGEKSQLGCAYSGDRVTKLYLPGTRSRVIAYRFSYHSTSTTVTDALGAKCVYNHKGGLITAKDHYLDTYSSQKRRAPDRKELFYWDTKNNEGELITKALADSDGDVYSAKTFAYDERGNVLQETFFGNLTGTQEPKPIAIDPNGHIDLAQVPL